MTAHWRPGGTMKSKRLIRRTTSDFSSWTGDAGCLAVQAAQISYHFSSASCTGDMKLFGGGGAFILLTKRLSCPECHEIPTSIYNESQAKFRKVVNNISWETVESSVDGSSKSFSRSMWHIRQWGLSVVWDCERRVVLQCQEWGCVCRRVSKGRVLPHERMLKRKRFLLLIPVWRLGLWWCINGMLSTSTRVGQELVYWFATSKLHCRGCTSRNENRREESMRGASSVICSPKMCLMGTQFLQGSLVVRYWRCETFWIK